MVVLSKKSLDVQVCTVILSPEGKLVVLGATRVSKQSFRLVAVYAPKKCRQSGFCRDLESFLVISETLVSLRL